MDMRRKVWASVAGLALLGGLAACGSSDPAPQTESALGDNTITVGSFDFPESALLAEIYSQAIERGGFDVDRIFNVGPRELVLPAMAAGFIEFVPEYLGTALQFLSLGAAEQTPGPARTFRDLTVTLDTGPFVALTSAPAQDSNAFYVTRETAEREGLATLSDVTAVADRFTFGGPPECASRPLCLIGLEETYGITFDQVIKLDTGGPVTRQALRDGAIDIALLFTTDPAIDSEGFVELTDDRALQPPENITPLVRREIVDRWGQHFVDIVDGVSINLTTADLRELNARVSAEPDALAEIAAAWLREQVPR
jgi:osmoprotectant transport system substrate-binding protein